MPTNSLAMPDYIGNSDIVGYLDNYVPEVSVGSQAAANTSCTIHPPDKYSCAPVSVPLSCDLSPTNPMGSSTLTIDSLTPRLVNTSATSEGGGD